MFSTSERSLADPGPPEGGIRLLLVEDDLDHAGLLRRAFAKDQLSWDIELCETLEAARRRLDAGGMDIVLTDLRLPDGRGEALLDYDVPVIVITSGGSEETAVEALRLGAVDYVVKSVDSMRAMPGRVARRFGAWASERAAADEQARLVAVLAAAERVTKLGNWQLDLRNGAAWGTSGQRELLGLTPDEPWPSWQTLWGWLGPKAGAMALSAMQDALHNRRPFDLEVTFKEGPVQGAIHRVVGEFQYDASGAPMRLWGVSQALTEQRRMEVELQQVKRLEGLGRLAGGVAHDFNNLLTVVLGHASFLAEDFAGDPGAMECVSAIQAAGERARDLTHQLLTFARKQMVEPELVSVSDSVQGLWQMLGRVLGAQLEVRVEVPDDLPKVYIDPSQLEQVFLNLAVNARDAMPRGGHLTVRGHAVPGDDHPWVVLEFVDDGPGIDEDVLPHIFEPFFTTKADGLGTGLGLATVYGIVHGAGGRIEVSSDRGGTRFRITLPGVRAPTAEDRRVSRPVLAAKGERVLVVDDDDGVRHVTVRMLESVGYDVVAASGGAEALQWLASNVCDIALVDVVMPGMTGADLAEVLAERHPGLPVVFMSGFADTPLITARIQQAPLVSKPFRADDLVHAIQRTLRDAPSSRPGD